MTEFLYGTRLYSSGDIVTVREVVANDEITTRTQLGLRPEPGGDARGWVSVVNQLFPPDHYAAWFMILSSFGSIFQPWHTKNEGGTLISLYGPVSGEGKSKILKSSAAIWGQWNGVSIKDYDTGPAQGLILAALCNIPGFVDELSHFARDPQYGIIRLREFVDKFSAGIDKHRALQFGTGVRHQLGQWAMSLLTASNHSIIDLLEVFGRTVIAPAMRVLEMRMPSFEFDQFMGERLDNELWKHAGWPADAFLKYVLRADILSHVKRVLPEVTAKLWQESRLGADSRFRIRPLGNAFVAGQLARELGLVPAALDQTAMIQWVVEEIKAYTQPEQIRPTLPNSIEALSHFLTDNINNTLRVQDAFKAGTKQLTDSRPAKLLIRHEERTGKLYTPQRIFKQFLVNGGYSYVDVIRYLSKEGIIKTDRRMLTLGAGTDFASAQVLCVEFDVHHPAICQTIREVPNEHARRIEDRRHFDLRQGI